MIGPSLHTQTGGERVHTLCPGSGASPISATLNEGEYRWCERTKLSTIRSEEAGGVGSFCSLDTPARVGNMLAVCKAPAEVTVRVSLHGLA